MNDDLKTFVLDTSALLAYTDDEESADVIVELLPRAHMGKLGAIRSFHSYHRGELK